MLLGAAFFVGLIVGFDRIEIVGRVVGEAVLVTRLAGDAYSGDGFATQGLALACGHEKHVLLFDGGDGIVLVGQTHQEAGIRFIGLGHVFDADFGQVFVDFWGVAVFLGDGFHNRAQCGFAPCFFLLLG